MSRPAPTSRTSAAAVCTTTSASRARVLRSTMPRPACWRPPRRDPEMRKAGSNPNAHAANTERPAVKSSATGSRRAVASPGMGAPPKPPATASGAARTSSGTPAHAMSAPTTPPAAARSSASVTCERTRSARPAPSARRTTRSSRRFSARTVNKLATFAQAMRKTMPTVPSRIHSAVEIRPTRCSRKGFTTGRWRSMIRTYGAGPPSRCCTRRASGSSCAISAAGSMPGFRRATARGPKPPGVTCAARIVSGTQNATRSSGKRKSGFMMPITERFWPAKL